MRHQKAGRKFGRNPAQRKALFRQLAISMILHERITTTEAKAKSMRSIVEKLVTIAREDSQAHRRPDHVEDRPPAGDGEVVRSDRAAIRRNAGRIHPDLEAGAAARRCGADGIDRVHRLAPAPTGFTDRSGEQPRQVIKLDHRV